MDELQNFIDKQAELNLQLANSVTTLTDLVDMLTNRVIQLEKDMKMIEENMGVSK